MYEELIERSPMRAVSASIRGGLEAGQVVVDVEMFGRVFEQRVDEALVEAA